MFDGRGSDHLQIALKIPDVNIKFIKCLKNINIRSVNWDNFREYFMNNFDINEDLNENNFLNHYDNLIKKIYDSLENSDARLPKNVMEFKKEPRGACWWNEKCTHLVNERRKAYKTFLNNSSIENYDYYIIKAKEANDGL